MSGDPGADRIGLHPASEVQVDLDAVRHNVRQLVAHVAPARVCAVVKADGYGHGATGVARAAVEAGAAMLAVARVDEALAVRAAGIDAPILVLSEPHPDDLEAGIEADVQFTVSGPELVDTLGRISQRSAGARPVAVHLKVDTGMHRAGVDPAGVVDLARRIESTAGLRLVGTCTHLAVADEPGRAETDRQLERFETALADLTAAGVAPGLRHAANSAGALWHRRSHFDMVRCGIALYGISPSPVESVPFRLRPVVRVVSRIALIRMVAAGEGVSYGWRFRATTPRRVATVPVGYADGLPRGWGMGGSVLIRGRRCPILGVITMDQLMVDVTDLDAVAIGEPVVVIGEQGAERVDVWEIAEKVGTIAYEVVCALRLRLSRRVTNFETQAP